MPTGRLDCDTYRLGFRTGWREGDILMATYLDGNVRKATANTVKAQRRSAETRRCPDCGRKSALTGYPRTCRWIAEGKCSPPAPKESWWDALGKPVPEEARCAAYDLLVANGCNPGEAALVVPVVCREIEHDEPDAAQKVLRHWLPAHHSETLVLQTIATICAVSVKSHTGRSPEEGK
jgi:hypothetical protein